MCGRGYTAAALLQRRQKVTLLFTFRIFMLRALRAAAVLMCGPASGLAKSNFSLSGELQQTAHSAIWALKNNSTENKYFLKTGGQPSIRCVGGRSRIYQALHRPAGLTNPASAATWRLSMAGLTPLPIRKCFRPWAKRDCLAGKGLNRLSSHERPNPEHPVWQECQFVRIKIW